MQEKVLLLIFFLISFIIVYNLKPKDTCKDLFEHISIENLRNSTSTYMVITILSAPRPQNQIHLLTTLESLITELEDDSILSKNVKFKFLPLD